MTGIPTPPGTVLVTGASGLVGGAVVEVLARDGWAVRALTHRTPVSATGVVSVAGELIDGRGLDEAVAGADAVVHAAAVLNGTEEHLAAVNVGGTERLARLARSAGVRRFVLLGSATVYGPGPHLDADERTPLAPADPYAASKLAAEEVAGGLLGDRQIVLRPGGVYRTGICPLLAQAVTLAGSPALPLVDEGGAAHDLVHADDLAELVRAALAADASGPFNVPGPEPAPFREIVELVARELGKTVRWVRPEGQTTFDEGLLQLASTPRTLSGARARSELGYAPTRRWREEIPRAIRGAAEEAGRR